MLLMVVATACGDDRPTPRGTARRCQRADRFDHDLGLVDRGADLGLVAELFNEPNPDVQISVDGPGTGDGFELFCTGEIDIADASRAIDEDEVTACTDGGIEYQELEVALDGITVMVNSASTIECLNDGRPVRDLRTRVRRDQRRTDANALSKKVGGAGDMPARTWRSRRPGEESGTYDAFLDLSGIEDIALENGVAEDARQRFAPTTSPRRTTT